MEGVAERRTRSVNRSAPALKATMIAVRALKFGVVKRRKIDLKGWKYRRQLTCKRR